ncbi:hypothetical protein B0T24DRAFT_207372 [Lasiosphaeria ovina]|uniref:Uncharacterized protein n=1 Tax=Lasiosphaeria ovina TaxID=92902 RepID=A0AAE0KFH7_9PEZI|nr:hypothetical protein B0T24DRAFT_207372 [Lasiosphaeria ovina]
MTGHKKATHGGEPPNQHYGFAVIALNDAAKAILSHKANRENHYIFDKPDDATVPIARGSGDFILLSSSDETRVQRTGKPKGKGKILSFGTNREHNDVYLPPLEYLIQHTATTSPESPIVDPTAESDDPGFQPYHCCIMNKTGALVLHDESGGHTREREGERRRTVDELESTKRLRAIVHGYGNSHPEWKPYEEEISQVLIAGLAALEMDKEPEKPVKGHVVTVGRGPYKAEFFLDMHGGAIRFELGAEAAKEEAWELVGHDLRLRTKTKL